MMRNSFKALWAANPQAIVVGRLSDCMVEPKQIRQRLKFGVTMKTGAIALCVGLLTAGCTSQQLLGAKCSFQRTNDPNAPRSYECTQLEQQQEEDARKRRHEREMERQRKAAQKQYRRESAQQVSALREALANMPDPDTLYQQGDFDGALNAAAGKTLRISETRSWFEYRDLKIPDDLSSLCAHTEISQAWYRLLSREFRSVYYPGGTAHVEGLGCYDQSVLHQSQAVRAHANMFEGNLEGADFYYFTLRGGPRGGPAYDDWEAWVAEDFRYLRDAGLDHPHMDEVLTRFAAAK